MALDVTSVTLMQTDLLTNLGQSFAIISQYALDLLYIFAGFEIVIFGLLWAMQQEMQWGRLFFKVLKIGIIFFIISNFTDLLQAVIESFADIGGAVANTANLGNYIFNPALLWKFGYDVSLALLKSGASAQATFGLALIQTILGLGIVLCFALICIQIVLQLISFYLISLVGLVFIPLGVFAPTTNMFEHVISSILKAGVRVVVLIFVVGLAVTTWQYFNLDKPVTSLTINQALGIFDSALLFAYLAMRLPKLVAEVVGRIEIDRTGHLQSATIVESPTVIQSAPPAVLISNMQAASSLTPGGGATNQLSSQPGAVSTSVQVSPTTNVNVSSPTKVSPGQRQRRGASLESAYQVEKSVSDETLKKLSKSFKKALDDEFSRGDG